jgi:MFS family permease
MWSHLSPMTALLGLGIVGLTYGATIATFPAAIANLFGVARGIRIYGLVFTAWGVAGLIAPWIAGILFERSNNYTSALLLATVLGVASILSIFWFPNETEVDHNDSYS